ncbi:unnamed protein product [Caenorhabditis bovis]|uniref:Uncharacterized protein n=1 Tax=Caenorhabditis bovis TaxID=2654633 RepID=A0A8S1ESF3_9PELO|nr:unnamed protein product [Caenorhabditis bovis]
MKLQQIERESVTNDDLRISLCETAKNSSVTTAITQINMNAQLNEVHKPVEDAVAENIIINPKKAKFAGNIDNKMKAKKVSSQLDDELRKAMEEKASNTNIPANNKRLRVKIKESKCKVYATNDESTEEEQSVNEKRKVST